MEKIITFGEIMLRLSPADGLRFLQTGKFEAVFGGSEANVAVALANMGINVSFVSKVPDNIIGKSARATLNHYGVDTSKIVKGGERLGIYYLEPGFSPCGSICSYDRKHSAIAEATPEEFDWDMIFKDAELFHFSGTTPALSDSAAKICLQACKKAQEIGILVSCDINYRSKLWDISKAQKVMQELCQYVDMVIINEEEAQILGVDSSADDLMEAEAYQNMARQLSDKYPFRLIASAFRIQTDKGLAVSGRLWQTSGKNNSYYAADNFLLDKIEDPVGAGDAFSAALIAALGSSHPNLQKALEFAVAACKLKHAVKGDYLIADKEQILEAVRANQGQAAAVKR